jgi:hypothetical protein
VTPPDVASPPASALAEPVKARPKRDNPADIPAAEIAGVLREHLEQQISLPEDELLRLAARTFGYARLGSNVEAAMRKGLAHAQAAKTVKCENGRAVIHTAVSG